MANKLYAKFAEALWLGTQGDLSTATIKLALMKNTYTPDLVAHDFLNDVSSHIANGGAAITTLSSLSFTNGAFDAADPTIAAANAGTGEVCNAVIIYKDTGNAATSPLMIYADTITNFPFTTDGTDVLFAFANTANKIVNLAG